MVEIAHVGIAEVFMLLGERVVNRGDLFADKVHYLLHGEIVSPSAHLTSGCVAPTATRFAFLGLPPFLPFSREVSLLASDLIERSNWPAFIFLWQWGHLISRHRTDILSQLAAPQFYARHA